MKTLVFSLITVLGLTTTVLSDDTDEALRKQKANRTQQDYLESIKRDEHKKLRGEAPINEGVRQRLRGEVPVAPGKSASTINNGSAASSGNGNTANQAQEITTFSKLKKDLGDLHLTCQTNRNSGTITYLVECRNDAELTTAWEAVHSVSDRLRISRGTNSVSVVVRMPNNNP